MRIELTTALRCARAALMAALLAAAPMAQEIAPTSENAVADIRDVSGSRFLRTALQLPASDPELRAQFARTALDVLADAYASEAQIARQEAVADGTGAPLLDWARAVEGYAGQMVMLREDVDAGYPVRFLLWRDSNLGMKIGERTVILAHPRVAAQPAFEQSVLGAFCRAHDCERWTGRPAEIEPIPVSAGRVRPVWTFSNDGASCAHRGLEVRFSPAFDVGRARSLCAQFMHEAQTLAVELRWQFRHAVDIDWDGLRLSATPGRPGHTLRLNPAGDAMLATLPLIFSSPGLLDALVPWLRSQPGSEEPVGVTLRAADFGWEGS